MEGEVLNPSIPTLEKELEDLKSEEKRLLAELEALQSEVSTTAKALNEQKLEDKRLKEEEDKYWREYNRHRRNVMLSEDDYKRLPRNEKHKNAFRDVSAR